MIEKSISRSRDMLMVAHPRLSGRDGQPQETSGAPSIGSNTCFRRIAVAPPAQPSSRAGAAGRTIGAPGETRTPTSLRTTDFESAASTGSATGAHRDDGGQMSEESGDFKAAAPPPRSS